MLSQFLQFVLPKPNSLQPAYFQILQSLQLMRRDITLYADLGKRYAALKRPAQAERAHTSIVEVLSAESESHTMLAEIRQKQDRWPEAIVHWRQVARIRELEPTGLLKLAAAQLHVKRWDDAGQTLRKLRARGWPSRFGDVINQIRQMERHGSSPIAGAVPRTFSLSTLPVGGYRCACFTCVC